MVLFPEAQKRAQAEIDALLGAGDALEALARELEQAQFDPYFTAVGGSGLGILSPYDHGGTAARGALLTPPETPAAGPLQTPLRDAFAAVSNEELGKWAEGRGRWLFV